MECLAGSTLELSLKSERLLLHTVRAGAVKAMVELLLSELRKASAGRQGAGRGASSTAASYPMPSAKLLQAAWGGAGTWGRLVESDANGGAGGTGRTESQAGWPLTRPPAGLRLRHCPAKLPH